MFNSAVEDKKANGKDKAHKKCSICIESKLGTYEILVELLGCYIQMMSKEIACETSRIHKMCYIQIVS